MKFTIAAIASLLVLFTAPATAHIRLLVPNSRGNVDATIQNGPCGGYDQPNGNTTTFTSTSDTLVSYVCHGSGTVEYLLQANGASSFQYLANQSVTALGSVSTPVDLSSLSNGTTGVIQSVFTSDNGTYYQCGDFIVALSDSSSAGASDSSGDNSAAGAGGSDNGTGSSSGATSVAAGAFTAAALVAVAFAL